MPKFLFLFFTLGLLSYHAPFPAQLGLLFLKAEVLLLFFSFALFHPSGTPSGSSSQETDLLPEMDQKKRKRMLSNRESARRSRERKQNHVNQLIEQVSQLKKNNGQILTTLNLTTQNYMSFEAENSVLRTQMMELTSRLNSLNEIIQNMNFYGNCSEPHIMISDNFIDMWTFLCKNQPIMASSEMIQFS